ncbi:MAG: hypothetical protein JWP36_1684 [Paucimonas sp.]|jgi:hypothetical protein|nr:hypothetical protein [Paucimonas sp.]
MRISRLACFALFATLAVPALAFERAFPQIAKRGQLSLEDYPSVFIDGAQRRLTPGAWIRNTNNTIDMPASLRGQRYTVNYTENAQGEIDRVWILTAQEAAQPAPADRKTETGLPRQ